MLTCFRWSGVCRLRDKGLDDRGLDVIGLGDNELDVREIDDSGLDVSGLDAKACWMSGVDGVRVRAVELVLRESFMKMLSWKSVLN